MVIFNEIVYSKLRQILDWTNIEPTVGNYVESKAK